MQQYIIVDQKSYYATVECVARGLDPMKTNLVVADPERSLNTICLAISPSMKVIAMHAAPAMAKIFDQYCIHAS